MQIIGLAPAGSGPLAIGEYLEGIDFRPANGILYAVASDGLRERVVGINVNTGVITQVNPPAQTAPQDGFFGLDFNPVADRIRVTGDLGSNRRFNPSTGGITVDTNLSYVAADPNFGATPAVVHNAYTNNTAGATTTTLYGIDTNTNSLVIIGSPNGTPDSPNDGVLRTVGPLGVDPIALGGFDIQQGTGTAYASLFVGNMPRLYTINLATGAATLRGTIGDGTATIDGLAIRLQPPPTAAGVEIAGRVMTQDGRGLRNARVTIIDSEGNSREVITSSFGSYSFSDVEAGQTYLVSVTSGRYRFATRAIQVSDSISDADFTAQE